MPGAEVFDGLGVNYAEHLLRHEPLAPDDVVFPPSFGKPAAGEDDLARNWAGRSYPRHAAARDGRSARPIAWWSYMPNVPRPQWRDGGYRHRRGVVDPAAPEFGTKTVIERFSQVAPKVLFAADGYRFGGKDFRPRGGSGRIVSELPTLERVIWLPTSMPATMYRICPRRCRGRV